MAGVIVHESLTQVKNPGVISEIADLPTEIFSPFRFLILRDLYRQDFVSFTNLKDTTGIKSDGNLVSHLRYLENQDLISVYQSFAGRYPKRFYTLTHKGREMVEKLSVGLSRYVEQIT